jgi:superfamily II DNA/RNA helicase
MEVDLVISFDANISPLRMIQRMGRTGRKHDGRVDILWLSILVVSWQLLLLRKKITFLMSSSSNVLGVAIVFHFSDFFLLFVTMIP